MKNPRGPPIARNTLRPWWLGHNEHVSNLWCTVVVPRGSAHSHSRAQPWFMPLVKQPLSRHQAPWKNYSAFPASYIRADSSMTQFSKARLIRESSKITFFLFLNLRFNRNAHEKKEKFVSLERFFSGQRFAWGKFFFSSDQLELIDTKRKKFDAVTRFDNSYGWFAYFAKCGYARHVSLSIRFHFIDRSIDAGSKLALKRRRGAVRRIVMGTWASSHGEMHFRLAPEATLSRDPDEGRGRTTKAAS